LEELVVLADERSRERAVHLVERLRAGDLRVALVGEAKRGKSTLGNAMLGADVLPTGVIPVTAISTEVRAGSPSRAQVRFADAQVVTVGVGDVGEYVSESGNPRNARNVAAVDIYLPEGLPHPRLVLVDSPGVGSVHEHNTAHAREAVKSVDAAVLVLTADSPMSASELALLREVTDQSVRVFIVLNKADQLSPAELGEAQAFVCDVVERAVGAPPQLWVCSARDAIRARECGDGARWLASGVPGFLETLLGYLVEHREADLNLSIATAAARLADQLLDGTVIALAAVEAVESAQENKLGELGRCLDRVAARRDEAVALIDVQLARARTELDADAACQVGQMGDVVRAALDTALAATAELSGEALESRGREVIDEVTRASVEAWRAEWQRRLDDTTTQLIERAQSALGEAAGNLYAEVLDLLGVRLHSQVPIIPEPDVTGMRYDFAPDIGWNQPAVAWLRTHAPRAVARRRTVALLREEARRLVDKHVGRARADLQQRLAGANQHLPRVVAASFDELTGDLAAGRDAVQDLGRRTEAENREERRHLETRRRAIEELTRQLRTAAAAAADTVDPALSRVMSREVS
jgi:hypothetical protein